MVRENIDRIYPAEIQLNKANSSDTEAPFLDLNLSISNGTVSTKIYDKRDVFDFDIVNFPFLDGDVPRRILCGVYISQLRTSLIKAEILPKTPLSGGRILCGVYISQLRTSLIKAEILPKTPLSGGRIFK